MGTLSKETGAVAGISQRQERYKRSAPAFLIILAALVLLLGFSMVLSVCTGIAGGSFKVFAETVMSPAKASGVGMIMLEMRMPRALAAGLTGMAFALSGAVMQGITRNPLSDAGLLGINAGAGFFVALSAILFPAAPDIVKTCAAFAGAALAVFMVYGFGAGKHRSESFRFILAGAAVSALLTALSQAVSLAFGIVKSLSFWSAGSLSGVTWQSLKMLSPVILSASALGLLLSSRLSALALGEDSAASLGVNVRTVRLFGMLVVLLLAGASVSLVGGIAFIGLIVPHIHQPLRPLRPSGVRRVRNTVPPLHMDAPRWKARRVALCEPPGLRQEILPQLTHAGRGAAPAGDYSRPQHRPAELGWPHPPNHGGVGGGGHPVPRQRHEPWRHRPQAGGAGGAVPKAAGKGGG